MIDALIAGKVYGTPKPGEGKNGNTYVTAKVKAAAGDGEPMLVNVIAFSGEACRALLALDEGDSVALTGSLTPKVWMDREGASRVALDMVAHAVLSAYDGLRKRQALADSRSASAVSEKTED